MLIVHHLNNSRSQRILWMLEELNADYQVVRYERDPKTMLAPPALLAIHPLGKSPVLTDHGEVVAESGHIVNYLAEQFDNLRPPGTLERRQADFWCNFAEGSAMTPLLLKLYASRLGEPGAALAARADQQTGAILAYVQAELADRPFLAGAELSTADIMMSFPLEVAMVRGGGKAFTGLVDYLARLHARDAYRRALERGGPYQIIGG